MLNSALKVVEEIKNRGFKAYIVGGFVRDYLLEKESKDIDIATNATPKELMEIFDDNCVPNEEYGSVIVWDRKIKYEITTFRKEIEYVDNRRPAKIKYIDDLYQDLLRRDFTINAICMDEKGKIIDYLKGEEDLNKKIIRCIGNAREKFEEDSLRMLRAIRFATILNFKLDEEVYRAILECKYLLKKLSYNRKREELDKIFSCPNAKYGIKLLLELGLDKELEIENLNKVKQTNSLIGVWSILNVVDKYPFNANEKELIEKINEAISLDNFDKMTLYKYGLYVNSVVCEIKNIDISEITEAYNNLTIQNRKDIDITSEEIMKVLDKEPGSYLKDIYKDLEKEILYNRLVNNKDKIVEYIKKKYA